MRTFTAIAALLLVSATAQATDETVIAGG